jgi:hypothetical protein
MNGRRGWWLVAAGLLLAVAVGVGAYNMGISEGLAQSGAFAEAARHGTYPYPYPYGWYRPWFGFGFFFPLFFLAFWFLIARAFLGGRRGYGRWGGGGPGQPPPYFEEWHRRAHESTPGPAPSPNH